MVFGFDTEIKRRTGTDGKEYKVCNGTFYSAGALDGAVLALEYAGVNIYMRGIRFTKGGR